MGEDDVHLADVLAVRDRRVPDREPAGVRRAAAQWGKAARACWLLRASGVEPRLEPCEAAGLARQVFERGGERGEALAETRGVYLIVGRRRRGGSKSGKAGMRGVARMPPPPRCAWSPSPVNGGGLAPRPSPTLILPCEAGGPKDGRDKWLALARDRVKRGRGGDPVTAMPKRRRKASRSARFGSCLIAEGTGLPGFGAWLRSFGCGTTMPRAAARLRCRLDVRRPPLKGEVAHTRQPGHGDQRGDDARERLRFISIATLPSIAVLLRLRGRILSSRLGRVWMAFRKRLLTDADREGAALRPALISPSGGEKAISTS